MNEIDEMRRGRLSEEYRERAVDGKIHRTGPYYKHQQWVDGKNVSRRVKPEEVGRLRSGIEGMDRFKKLSDEFIEETVAMTEERDDGRNSKKNSG